MENFINKTTKTTTVIPKMKKLLMIWLLLGSIPAKGHSQKITNELLGYFKATSDSALYDYFTFYGNGIVDIAGWEEEDYFQKEDTVIVYPDKGIFKFVLKDDRLYGASQWVKGSIWELQPDTAIITRRTEPAQSDQMAGWMYQYYQLKGNNSRAFKDEIASMTRSMKALCDSGLARACLDYSGLRILDEVGVEAILSGKTIVKKRAPNPEIMNSINRAIRLGAVNGYAVLGGYYAAIGDSKMAKKALEGGAALGCRKCAMTALGLALEEEAKKKETEEKKKAAEKTGSKKQ
ncbi:hypothetical protein A8C56_14810 [Niabella ginsenosidivorans]|uniref:Uncharacterized protein n=1 Tax=Niabella ginsenosidivorans TaxID=1176587 RepID=A0A1A9I3G5_9BACT|nr:hypothetical protein [Niabella ginsenosidivorans]ANH82073.1 hypothetical protein A8C56_14810 [Niabella ginsenosidivorans]